MPGVEPFDARGVGGHLFLQFRRKALVAGTEHIGGGHAPPGGSGQPLLERQATLLDELAQGMSGQVVREVPVQRCTGIVEDEGDGAVEVLLHGGGGVGGVNGREGVTFRGQVGREIDEMGDVWMGGDCLGDRELAVGVGDDDYRAVLPP